MKPLLKWAGGKSRLAPSICEAFGGPCQGTYYEPFCGSAAVFLYRRACSEAGHAVLADVNAKLVAFHVAVRDDVEELISALASMPSEDYRDHYYDIRDAFNAGPHEGAEHAARFAWLNRAGFNGLYRENRKGHLNVPVGRYSRVAIPEPDRFREVSAALQGIEILHASFEEVMARAGEGDHVYCDPPYVPLSATASFTAYQKEPFGPDEQQALASAARRAAVSGARVVLSNHDLPLVRRELYPLHQGFEHVASPSVRRAISRKSSSRQAVAEVIARIGPLGEPRRVA